MDGGNGTRYRYLSFATSRNSSVEERHLTSDIYFSARGTRHKSRRYPRKNPTHGSADPGGPFGGPPRSRSSGAGVVVVLPPAPRRRRRPGPESDARQAEESSPSSALYRSTPRPWGRRQAVPPKTAPTPLFLDPSRAGAGLQEDGPSAPRPVVREAPGRAESGGQGRGEGKVFRAPPRAGRLPFLKETLPARACRGPLPPASHARPRRADSSSPRPPAPPDHTQRQSD